MQAVSATRGRSPERACLGSQALPMSLRCCLLHGPNSAHTASLLDVVLQRFRTGLRRARPYLGPEAGSFWLGCSRCVDRERERKREREKEAPTRAFPGLRKSTPRFLECLHFAEANVNTGNTPHNVRTECRLQCHPGRLLPTLGPHTQCVLTPESPVSTTFYYGGIELGYITPTPMTLPQAWA